MTPEEVCQFLASCNRRCKVSIVRHDESLVLLKAESGSFSSIGVWRLSDKRSNYGWSTVKSDEPFEEQAQYVWDRANEVLAI